MLTVDPVERANADYSIKHPWLRKHNGDGPQYSSLDFSNEVIIPITKQKSINEMRNLRFERRADRLRLRHDHAYHYQIITLLGILDMP
ncbi:unnamed protein product [Rotaria sordida]|uniref:Uncharacterized protein n=1 Tax=Rotaria sordida TaxID=392033 RepID=A0A815N2T2_9BILA|nr:unnamed protein product [Rotaria sordida]